MSLSFCASYKPLHRTIKIGGIPLGGSMPAFADKLSDTQIDAILAWIQFQWPVEIYGAWLERNISSGSLKPYTVNGG